MHTAAHVTDAGEAPDHTVARTQVRDILERKVSQLPDMLRVVFVLRSVEDLTVPETAEALGIPQETVRIRHFRAKGLLRESLAKEVDLAEKDIYNFGGKHCDAVVANVLRRLPP
jgi:RNA polymerase sigma-70 factor (ECF subfamily)